MDQVKKRLLAILGPTGTGKSALGLALAEAIGGEIVSCDSTAVYRGFDIGTDKVPFDRRRGIPHHLIDVADPTEEYTAARYVRDAAEAIQGIETRERLPIIVGGTGFYFRALTRGLFPGPGRDRALRARLDTIAARRGSEFLHRALARVDRASAMRIQPRDRMRIVRAIEVYLLTGRPISEHFASTTSLIEGCALLTIGLHLPGAELVPRLARRVDDQFERGLVDEIRGLLAQGVPEGARPFGGLGYRQALDHLHGLRDLSATRALIVSETRRYARRQLIWFRKEPNLVWIQGAGESPVTLAASTRLLEERFGSECPPVPREMGC